MSGPTSIRPIVGFLARFVGGWVVVLATAAWLPGIERWWVRATIVSLDGTARLLHVPFFVTGSTLNIAGAAIEIVPDCTPLMPTSALVIAMLAFPAPWRWRLLGVGIGAAALWLYNLLRIYALVPVLLMRPEWFDFIHVYLWQTVTLLVVFGLFVTWLGIQHRTGRSAPAVPLPDAGG